MSSHQKIIEHIEFEEKIRSSLFKPDMEFLSKAPKGTLLMFTSQLQLNRSVNACDGCSKCCEDTDIDLSYIDVERLSAYLKISQEQFVEKYCSKHPKYPLYCYRFKFKPCVFLNEQKCKVYESRPTACVFYPFLSPLQEQTSDIFNRNQQSALVVPVGCQAAIKTKNDLDSRIAKLANY